MDLPKSTEKAVVPVADDDDDDDDDDSFQRRSFSRGRAWNNSSRSFQHNPATTVMSSASFVPPPPVANYFPPPPASNPPYQSTFGGAPSPVHQLPTSTPPPAAAAPFHQQPQYSQFGASPTQTQYLQQFGSSAGLQNPRPPPAYAVGLDTAADQYIAALTASEKAAVDRLIEMGFSKANVVQMYEACDKSEELTMNLLSMAPK
jgi:hypothetical protein